MSSALGAVHGLLGPVSDLRFLSLLPALILQFASKPSAAGYSFRPSLTHLCPGKALPVSVCAPMYRNRADRTRLEGWLGLHPRSCTRAFCYPAVKSARKGRKEVHKRTGKDSDQFCWKEMEQGRELSKQFVIFTRNCSRAKHVVQLPGGSQSKASFSWQPIYLLAQMITEVQAGGGDGVGLASFPSFIAKYLLQCTQNVTLI